MEATKNIHRQTIFVPLQALKASKDGERIEFVEFISAQLSVEKECVHYFEEQYKVHTLNSFCANKENPIRELPDWHS